MELMHNSTFRIACGVSEGLYRVICLDHRSSCVAVAAIERVADRPKVGARQKAVTKRADQPRPPKLVGALTWFSLAEIAKLEAKHQICLVEVRLPALSYQAMSPAAEKHFKDRKLAMARFLNNAELQRSIVKHHGWGDLVAGAMEASGLGRTVIYKLLSQLCRLGFNEQALRPDLERCGAPDVPRPIDPGGRVKAGRKTAAQRVARETGGPMPDAQPGVSTVWRALILAADAEIPKPKPRMSERVERVQHSRFATVYVTVGSGTLVRQLGPQGSYPTRQQISRVLRTGISELDRIKNATTPGHFASTKGGRRGKSIQGVGGPGHTYAIDSTIADAYLRSSINRSWVLGRPIVYVIVDVWSTAVVGFYVCLAGPSWNMAKVAIFNSCISSSHLSALWGYDNFHSLTPHPTLPAILLCDRGEYLSQAGGQTSLKLKLSMSYTPPYRGDLKGDVEVLHRIAKDGIWMFVPGAIDARRKELELRKFDPWRSMMTIREFVHFLHIYFARYNLTANRSDRLDASMIADGVTPSPEGLWRWGHAVGIGYRRADRQDDLIDTLLLRGSASVVHNGILWDGRLYTSPEVISQQWTTLARHSGSYPISTRVYPGALQNIWTPDHGGNGMLELSIFDESTASGKLCMDEVMDAKEIQRIRNPGIEHDRRQTEMMARSLIEQLTDSAVARTKEAEGTASKDDRSTPISVARQLEQGAAASPDASEAVTGKEGKASAKGATTVPQQSSEAEQNYMKQMAALLNDSTEVA